MEKKGKTESYGGISGRKGKRKGVKQDKRGRDRNIKKGRKTKTEERKEGDKFGGTLNRKDS